MVCLILLLGGHVTVQSTGWLDKLNKKQFREILQEAEPLSPADSADFQKMYILGQAYEGLLKYREAYQVYTHCFRMDSLNVDLMNTLGRTAVNLGKAKDAQFYFRQVLENDSSNFYANHQLARLYFQSGDYEQAADQYHLLEEQDPENPAILKSLGDCYIKMEETMIGASYYYSAYDRNKENAGLASLLINTQLRMGGDFVVEALSLCDTALFYNPDNMQLLSNKGMALYINKKYAEADTIYTYLLEKGDSTYMNLKYGGSVRYYAGFAMNAIHPLEIAYAMDTTSVEVPLLLGSALGKTYDRKQAYEMLDVAERNMQPLPLLVTQLQLFRAETYQKDGNYAEASRLYYQVWKENPKRLDLIYKITNMYFEQKQEDYKSEENRQRGLFGSVLFVREFFKNGQYLNTA